MGNETTDKPSKGQEETLVWLEHYRKTLQEMNSEEINSGDFTYIQPRDLDVVNN